MKRRNHYTLLARKAVKDSLATIDNNAHIGIGCSGGADSLALLLALSTLYKQDRAKLVHVVIVDHQLQDETADISIKTKDFAESFGFNAYIVPVDVKTTKNGAESDARKARYQAYRDIIDEKNLQAFLIAHTQTDQAEQVFLGLLRGSGTRSLAGIRENREVFKRPFLNRLSRKDTQSVCNESNVDYWCDPHNDLVKYKRVAVRKLISETEKATGDDIINPLVKTAQIASEDADALDFYADIAYNDFNANNWAVKKIAEYPVAVRKRVFRRKIIEMGSYADTVSFEITNRVNDFIDNWHGQKFVSVSNGVIVSRVDNKLVFRYN